MIRLLLAALALPLLLVAACGPTIQTSSGRDYLAARGPVTDPAIRAAASVEPDLRFPARIALARVVNGTLTTAPPAEMAELGDFVRRHAAMGEWVPVSPMVHAGLHGGDRATTEALRATAARQHADYLLVYELGARGHATGNTPFALADVSLIGGLLLPTRTTRATGVGAAALIDVRNGYPYATTGTSVRLDGLARSFNGDRATRRLMDRATADVARALLPEVDAMLRRLRAAAR